MKRQLVQGFRPVGGGVTPSDFQGFSGFIAGDFEESFTQNLSALRWGESSRTIVTSYECERGGNTNSAFQTAILNQAILRGNKVAFTLAEVLITLGIIGVVAAITMPVLLTNIQNRVKAKRVENIKQKLSKVTDKMAVLSGLSGYGTTSAFVNEMTKHMKVAKVCDNNHIADCWPTGEVNLNKDGKMWDISKTKNAKTLQIGKDIRDSWDDTMAIVTADGVPMILSYKKDCDFDVDKTGLIFNKSIAMSNSVGCLSGVFDWNGGKNPNKLGDDVMIFGKAAGLGNECAVEIGNKCFTAASIPSPLTRAQCEEQKEKLGIKGCYYDNDFWAGAVAECGGVQNMPTMQDLADFASSIYRHEIGAYDRYYGGAQYDFSLYTAITGKNEFENFEIWSGEETSGDMAYSRYFYTSSTLPNWSSYWKRSAESTSVVCVK